MLSHKATEHFKTNLEKEIWPISQSTRRSAVSLTALTQHFKMSTDKRFQKAVDNASFEKKRQS